MTTTRRSGCVRADWLTAVRCAGLIGTYSRTYGLGIYEPAAIDLLALLLYTTGAAAAGGADAVDLDTVLEQLADADDSRRARDALEHLHTRLAIGLRQAGHDPDTQLAAR